MPNFHLIRLSVAVFGSCSRPHQSHQHLFAVLVCRRTLSDNPASVAMDEVSRASIQGKSALHSGYTGEGGNRP